MTADKRRVCLFAVDLYSPDESPADQSTNQFIIKKKQKQKKQPTTTTTIAAEVKLEHLHTIGEKKKLSILDEAIKGTV